MLEREQADGPVMLDGDTFRISMNAVLPGNDACPSRVVRIGAGRAERSPGERPPRRVGSRCWQPAVDLECGA